VLPVVIFFAALMAVLYHIGVMQWVVQGVGWFLNKVLGTGRVESLNASANIFVGQTEAPLVVKPYLDGITKPQLFAIMTSGLASVAGTVLAGYAQMGIPLSYLLGGQLHGCARRSIDGEDPDAGRQGRGQSAGHPQAQGGPGPPRQCHHGRGCRRQGRAQSGAQYRRHADRLRLADCAFERHPWADRRPVGVEDLSFR
jgi:hypothetical protein